MMMHYNNGSNYVNGSYADEVEYTLSLRRNLDPQVIPGGDWGQHYNVISVANRTIYLAKVILIKIGRICILVKGIF